MRTSGRPSLDKTGVAITLVVLVIVATIGIVVIGAVNEDLGVANDDLEYRAEETYGENYRVVASDACMDYCVSTAVRPSNQMVALLIEADRSDGWVSSYELSRGVPGADVEPAASRLVDAGVLEQRDNGWMRTEYRYTGPDGIHEDGLTDAELRTWVENQLYLTDAWLTFDDVANSVPAVDWRVRQALADLQQNGEVQTDEESMFQLLPVGGTTVYAHENVDHSPPGPPGAAPLIEPLVLVFPLVLVVGVIQRFRGEDPADT